MAGYLPRSWTGKRAAVVFQGQGGGGFEANLVSDSDGGVLVEVVEEDEGIRRMFLPWAALRYVELLEEPEERSAARLTRRPEGL